MNRWVRSRPQDYDPTFRIPGPLYPIVPIVPIVGFFACIAILLQMTTLVQLIGIAIVLLGVVPGVREGPRAPDPPRRGGDRPAVRIGARRRPPVPGRRPRREPRNRGTPHPPGRRQRENPRGGRDRGHQRHRSPAPDGPRAGRFRTGRHRPPADAARSGPSNGRGDGDRPSDEGIVGRDAGEAILHVIEDESADEAVMGWRGHRQRRDYILGSTIDPVFQRTPCEVTLVKWRDDRVGETVVFVGEGPHSRVAVRRAAAYVGSEPGATLTLVNVQPSVDDQAESTAGDEPPDPQTRGQEVIDGIVAAAGSTIPPTGRT